MFSPICKELINILFITTIVLISLYVFFLFFFSRLFKSTKSFFSKIWTKTHGNKFVLLCAGLYAFILLAASFLAPHFLVPYSLEHPLSSNVATTINGLMNPFIAIAAAILTFMAFWVQYNANQNIYRENKKQQNERQFYEMLKIHRDNVDKMEFMYSGYTATTITESKQHPGCVESKQTTSSWLYFRGQKAIQNFLVEFKIIYMTFPSDTTDKFKKAYDVFFNGVFSNTFCSSKEKELLMSKRHEIYNKGSSENEISLPWSSIMNGHKDVLNPYYRHLYLTVKSIVDSNFGEDEKKMFLKTLRASLTAEEQALLLFNWYYGKLNGDGYGIKWEYEGEINHKYCNQKYFTEWKMIHNLVGKDFQFVSEMDSFKKLAVLLDSNFNADNYDKLRELFEEA